MKKKILTWSDIAKCKKQLRKYKGHIDCIVCILRGGAVPATIASNILDVPVYYLEFRSYIGTKQSSTIEYKDYSVGSSIKDKRLLIVDDIFDTGKTIECAKKVLQRKKPKSIDVFVLVTKDKEVLLNKATVVPYSYMLTCPVGTWAIYPWEN